MLRRQCLRRTPYILNLRRLASRLPLRRSRDPFTALEAALNDNSAESTNEEKPQAPPPLRKPVKLIDPVTRKEITIDLSTVEVFSEDFAKLPLQYRSVVERGHLRQILRKRLSNEYRLASESAAEHIQPKPSRDDIKGYMIRFMRNRRTKTDEPPSEQKIQQLLKLAKQKALKKAVRREHTRRTRKIVEPVLSFEEQWRRRQEYGTLL
jgi:hypothetical protein